MQPIRERLAAVASALSPDPRTAPRLARQLGLRGMLFDSISSQLNIPDLSATGRREFRQTLSSQDQQLIGLQLDLGSKGLSPGADVDRQIARLDRAMEAAAGLGSPLLCIELGPLPAPPPSSKPRAAIPAAQAGVIIIPQLTAPQPLAPASPPPDPAFVSQVNSALTEIGALADRYSVTLAFSTAMASFASLNETLIAARCPWFGVDLDPLAILRDDWDRNSIFSSIGPLVRHLRARDGAVGAEKRIKPAAIGGGDVGWETFLSLLDEAGYHGFITLDPLDIADRPGAIRSGAEHLLKIGG